MLMGRNTKDTKRQHQQQEIRNRRESNHSGFDPRQSRLAYLSHRGAFMPTQAWEGLFPFSLPFFLGSYLVWSPGQDTAQYTHTIWLGLQMERDQAVGGMECQGIFLGGGFFFSDGVGLVWSFFFVMERQHTHLIHITSHHITT
ncbi:hypothetical protein B0T18DRAFT_99318 [Schizothecium vesticola]|uniref:Uncharacterized protein n=1 Tax=Schizothecium vesticola TaxID=314040 RepID=A0AA40F168_9PEZI|nr:hypothetical protein B0T18DRAFT_99318 [Schizothecium vesticola]